LPLTTLASHHKASWLTLLAQVPVQDRYRPLLPLLRFSTPGLYLRERVERHHIMQAYTMKPSVLDSSIRAYPVPEELMMHRLNDIALVLRHHLYGELPAALLRRPWAYSEYRHPHEAALHTIQGCLERGRLDLIEDPLWALARAESSH
jgi:hypothetical protein